MYLRSSMAIVAHAYVHGPRCVLRHEQVSSIISSTPRLPTTSSSIAARQPRTSPTRRPKTPKYRNPCVYRITAGRRINVILCHSKEHVFFSVFPSVSRFGRSDEDGGSGGVGGNGTERGQLWLIWIFFVSTDFILTESIKTRKSGCIPHKGFAI